VENGVVFLVLAVLEPWKLAMMVVLTIAISEGD
jgi:hypothetical protein